MANVRWDAHIYSLIEGIFSYKQAQKNFVCCKRKVYNPVCGGLKKGLIIVFSQTKYKLHKSSLHQINILLRQSEKAFSKVVWPLIDNMF